MPELVKLNDTTAQIITQLDPNVEEITLDLLIGRRQALAEEIVQLEERISQLRIDLANLDKIIENVKALGIKTKAELESENPTPVQPVIPE